MGNICKWFKRNKYLYNTECKIQIYLADGEINEILYCRHCGKKVKVI